MDRIKWLNHIHDVIYQGPYLPSMDSLKAYTPPDWYLDGKLGIFIHWGVYSVPAFQNEWYPRDMYRPGTACFEHHVKTYGPHGDFGYKDFIPLFKAENYDPAAWAELFSEAGARFIVPVAEHHDGFQMYRSELSHWNAFEMGPRRDVLGALKDSVEERGLVFGASSHRAEHWWFMDGVHTFDSDYTPEYEDFYGPAMPAPVNTHDPMEAPPSSEYLDDWLVRSCELVDRYMPKLIWFDWWINNRAFRPYLEKFAAYYYNRAAERDIGVAINYKYQAYDTGCAVFDVERGQLSGILDQFWQNDTSISKNSWGFVHGQDYKHPTDLLLDLADIVSKNGALLLNIGPKPDGTIPELEAAALRAIGRWMKANGEAIYGTRPFRVFGEGPTAVPEGAFTDTKRQAFNGRDIRYTTKENALYALVLGVPEDGEVCLREVKPQDGCMRATTMDGAALSMRFSEDGLRIQLPEAFLKKPLPLAIRLTR